jgi:hypothetical protein
MKKKIQPIIPAAAPNLEFDKRIIQWVQLSRPYDISKGLSSLIKFITNFN